MIETKFELKPKQEIQFTETGTEYKIKNNTNKKKEITIKIK